jgi:enediyne biosynthesis protein E4
VMREFPAHFWEELNSQSPKFRRKFAYYRDYGKATMQSLLTPDDLKEAVVLETNHTASSYIENLGNGQFNVSPLPVEAQMAPVHGMVTSDVNGDGFLDVLMVGNDYGNEVFSGRYDAFGGLLLLGDGKGGFRSLRSLQSGFSVPGDAKALAILSWRGSTAYIASQNRDSLRMFAPPVEKRFEFTPDPYETYGELTFNDGSQQRIEFYWGSGYLAQSSRKIRLPGNVKELTVYDSRGKPRTITPSSM